MVPCQGTVEGVHPLEVVEVAEDHHREGEGEEVDHRQEMVVEEGAGVHHRVEAVEGEVVGHHHQVEVEGVVEVVQHLPEGVEVRRDRLKSKENFLLEMRVAPPLPN